MQFTVFRSVHYTVYHMLVRDYAAYCILQCASWPYRILQSTLRSLSYACVSAMQFTVFRSVHPAAYRILQRALHSMLV